MWLNLDRHMMRQTWPTYQAIAFALGRGALPYAFYDAIANTEEEAAELEFAGNTEREKQAAFEDLNRGKL